MSNVLDLCSLPKDLNLIFRDRQSNRQCHSDEMGTFRLIRAALSRSDDVVGRRDFAVRSSSEVSEDISAGAEEAEEDEVDS